jgi:hypothetical protein
VRVHHGLQFLQPRFERRHLQRVIHRQAAAALVVAHKPKRPAQPLHPGATQRGAQVVLDVGEPVRDADQRGRLRAPVQAQAMRAPEGVRAKRISWAVAAAGFTGLGGALLGALPGRGAAVGAREQRGGAIAAKSTRRAAGTQARPT